MGPLSPRNLVKQGNVIFIYYVRIFSLISYHLYFVFLPLGACGICAVRSVGMYAKNCVLLMDLYQVGRSRRNHIGRVGCVG